jgi:hypothetical protein
MHCGEWLLAMGVAVMLGAANYSMYFIKGRITYNVHLDGDKPNGSQHFDMASSSKKNLAVFYSSCVISYSP